jgi:hypothetical protein
VPRGDWQSYNKMIQAGMEETSSPALHRFVVALQELKNGYASTMSRSNQGSVFAMQSADKLTNTSKGQAAFEGGMDQMKIGLTTVLEGIIEEQKAHGIYEPPPGGEIIDVGGGKPTQSGTTSTGVTWSQ